MLKLKPPEELSFSDTQMQAERYRMRLEEMSLYLNYSETSKRSAFLYTIGRSGREIHITCDLTSYETNKMEVFFSRFWAGRYLSRCIMSDKTRKLKSQSQNESVEVDKDHQEAVKLAIALQRKVLGLLIDLIKRQEKCPISIQQSIASSPSVTRISQHDNKQALKESPIVQLPSMDSTAQDSSSEVIICHSDTVRGLDVNQKTTSFLKRVSRPTATPYPSSKTTAQTITLSCAALCPSGHLIMCDQQTNTLFLMDSQGRYIRDLWTCPNQEERIKSDERAHVCVDIVRKRPAVMAKPFVLPGRENIRHGHGRKAQVKAWR
ncbi:hypothetical protein PoB_004627100 [Plakobranchus ocellatus]|uniref:Uncharacterized protein n=1 Tax=Plakobranchus ocellatus TaxID=259542 RepID=A0AAV4B8S2_9GAST|nr:hypothetical protein PoB_004627100 [Plakobranchus ocellatus]